MWEAYDRRRQRALLFMFAKFEEEAAVRIQIRFLAHRQHRIDSAAKRVQARVRGISDRRVADRTRLLARKREEQRRRERQVCTAHHTRAAPPQHRTTTTPHQRVRVHGAKRGSAFVRAVCGTRRGGRRPCAQVAALLARGEHRAAIVVQKAYWAWQAARVDRELAEADRLQQARAPTHTLPRP
eukprot:6105808-Prymnesium_polylepis.1